MALAILVAGGSGYWLGGRGADSAPTAAPSAGEASSGPSAPSGQKPRKILYYRNPMGLPDTSPVPKKDPMGMDYLPVYEGGDEDEGGRDSAGSLKISPEKIQKLGVRSEAVAWRVLDKVVRSAGRVEPDERHLFAISPKFEGYVERLHVNITGQAVGRGQPLFEVYSPELISAQREYLLAVQGVAALKDAGPGAQDSMRQLAEASLARLRNWDISEEQIKTLARSGEARRSLTFRSPVSGIITEKKALQGMRFQPGEALYQVADLSSVWVVADVFEQDIGQIKTGARATVRINAYPDQTFEGKISYVYPTLNAETRTVPVRVELANPGLRLKPGMFAQVELPVGAQKPVLTLAKSAIIDSGTRQIVLVRSDGGRFQAKRVRVGQASEQWVEVLEGVQEGEDVVVSANFLIDAESNLKSVVEGLNAPASSAGAEVKRAVSHQAEGTLDAMDTSGALTITHGPVASLKWPGMTMEFKAANPALVSNIKPGTPIQFEFVERGQGEWVITRVAPMPASTTSVNSKAAKNPHAGH